ncbi:hypothetical protein D1819_06865 [Pseudoalteromonas tunicata]|nr:hypothetical protein D1819_06865 [Pseudoalteromonas tunicata]
MGCGSSDEVDEALEKNAKFSFVNSLDSTSDFYVDKRSISLGYSGLFDSKNRVSDDVSQNSVGATYSYNYKAINNMVNVGVKESNGNEEKNYDTLKDGDNLWVIAWQSGNDKKISFVNKKKQDQADIFNVRVFASGNYSVAIDGNQATATKSGEISSYMAVNNCANGLAVNGVAIDLCTGDFGKSYLVVVDANGKRVMAQE